MRISSAKNASCTASCQTQQHQAVTFTVSENGNVGRSNRPSGGRRITGTIRDLYLPTAGKWAVGVAWAPAKANLVPRPGAGDRIPAATTALRRTR